MKKIQVSKYTIELIKSKIKLLKDCGGLDFMRCECLLSSEGDEMKCNKLDTCPKEIKALQSDLDRFEVKEG